jgi:hypothetical protein
MIKMTLGDLIRLSVGPVDMRAKEPRCIIAVAGGGKIATRVCARVSPVV